MPVKHPLTLSFTATLHVFRISIGLFHRHAGCREIPPQNFEFDDKTLLNSETFHNETIFRKENLQDSKNDGDSVANIGVRDKQGGVQWLAGLILNHSTRDCMHEYETTVLVGI